ncbi:MAG: hypothetical protein QQN62_07270 [Nitrosopumilus sp.]
MNFKGIILCFWGVMIFFFCVKDDGVEKIRKTFIFNFQQNLEEWTADFADYPEGEDIFYELDYGHSPLPLPLDTTQNALKISGNNHSADLFMFIKRRISGLTPNTEYQVLFDIVMVSNAPVNSVGIGGSPGSNVYLKVGATIIEPEKIVVDDFYIMNIDKNNQSSSGKDMIQIGNIGTKKDIFEYTLIKRNNFNKPFKVKTDVNGEVWLIVGTDSGFEGKTTLYYYTITVKLN